MMKHSFHCFVLVLLIEIGLSRNEIQKGGLPTNEVHKEPGHHQKNPTKYDAEATPIDKQQHKYNISQSQQYIISSEKPSTIKISATLSSSTITPNPKNSSEPILPEWGGNCTKKDWEKCSNLGDRWVTSHYKDVKHPELGFTYHETDCKLEPILCLQNGWTATRCQLLCMHKCNRKIFSKYDEYVKKEGAC